MSRHCALVAVLATTLSPAIGGCAKTSPAPLPVVARESGVSLLAKPEQLVIRPAGSGRIRFQVRDEAQRPLAYYPVDFTIQGEPGQETADARLSTLHSLTDARGDTVVEVIVGTLTASDRPVQFAVVATCPGAFPAPATIVVTSNAYFVEILPMPADDVPASGQVTATRLYFFDNSACKDVDLYAIDHSVAQARSPQPLVPANGSFVFPGVAASGVHAVVGLGLDSEQTVLVGGCVDIPGAALLEAETMRATLVLDRLFPAVTGTFAVSSDFRLSPPPKPVDAIRLAWQQWQRCPYDPARLWLDCTLAALGPDPTSCVPSAFTANSLGDLISARRGTVVPALLGTLPSASDTPCHGDTDSAGNSSLEVAVDALFANARAPLTAAGLGNLATELATLLDDVRISSKLSFAKTRDANAYLADHRLLAVTFPDALSPGITLGINQPEGLADLAVPVPAVSGILATCRAGQLSLPDHGFTLRLGAAARFAFETASLTPRNGATGTEAFVEGVFALAQSADPRSPLTECAALDAMVCQEVNQPRNCIINACRAGLAALGRKLAGAFDSLDGVALDFRLSGSAPAIDLDGDGRADALGNTGIGGGVAAGPGLWSAVMEASAGTYVMYGSWLATRDPTSP